MEFQDMIPVEMNSYASADKETKDHIFQYLSQLDSFQQKAYMIAKEHLGSSFHLLKSNGYLDWKKNK